MTVTTSGIRKQLFRTGYECWFWTGWFLSSFPQHDSAIDLFFSQRVSISVSTIPCSIAGPGKVINSKLPMLHSILSSYLFIFNCKGFVFMWHFILGKRGLHSPAGLAPWSLCCEGCGQRWWPWESKARWHAQRQWPFEGWSSPQSGPKTRIWRRVHQVAQSLRQCRRLRKHRLNPWVRKIPWRRRWQPTPVFLPGKFLGQRSLAGYSPWDCRESDTTERLNHNNKESGSLLAWWPLLLLTRNPSLLRKPIPWPNKLEGVSVTTYLPLMGLH